MLAVVVPQLFSAVRVKVVSRSTGRRTEVAPVGRLAAGERLSLVPPSTCQLSMTWVAALMVFGVAVKLVMRGGEPVALRYHESGSKRERLAWTMSGWLSASRSAMVNEVLSNVWSGDS